MNNTYSVELQRAGSNTLSTGSIVADATRPRRGELLSLVIGSEATPADNQFLWRVRGCTAAGTSTAVTPTADDPGSPATESDCGENHTVEPTYAGISKLSIPLHQRATFQWKRDVRGIVWPGTASNGIGLDTPTATGVAVTAHARWEE